MQYTILFPTIFNNAIPEGKLKHVRVKGVSSRALDTLRLIADNIANYTRIKLEEGGKIIEVKRLLPITHRVLELGGGI